MTDLDKDTEAKILEVVKPYHKEEDYQLNYLITDDNIINIFSSINIGNAIKTEDLFNTNFSIFYYFNKSFFYDLIKITDLN